jgi:carotenoid cleavage dioxygenase
VKLRGSDAFKEREGQHMRRPPKLHYGVVDAAGDLRHSIEIDVPRAAYTHDFAITETRTVLLDMPLLFDPRRLLERRSPYVFDPGRPARFGVLPRHGQPGEVRWLETSACFIAHTANAWDDGDAVVLLAGRMDDIELGLPQVEGGPVYRSAPRLTRFRLDLSNGRVEEEIIDGGAVEFFQVHPARAGRRSRFAWAGRLSPHQPFALDGVARIDLETGSVRESAFGPGCFGGDFQIVPRAGADAEDDAWLLVLTHDERAGASSLRVLDARAMSDEPIATVHLPRRVPYGVHSLWLPAAPAVG